MEAIVPGNTAITTASSDPTSIPSSSAFVATTARISPERQTLLNLAALARQVSAPVTAHRVRRHASFVAGVFQIRHEDLGGEPVIREDQRLLIVIEQLKSNAPRFGNVTAPDAQLPVDDRWVVADEDLLPRLGAPLRSINWNGCSIKAWASSLGFAMVAEQAMNCGFEP